MAVVVRTAVLHADSSQVFNVPVHWNTMPQINMIPHPSTLYWQHANQSGSNPLNGEC